MQQSKAFQLLSRLSPAERNVFNRYLLCRYPPSTELYRLWQLIPTPLPSAPQAQLSNERLFATLYPDQAYQVSRIRTLSFLLYQALRDFLAELELDSRPLLRERLCLSQLRQRQLEAPFRSLHKRIGKAAKSQGYRDADYDFLRYELANEANAFFGQQHVRKQDESLRTKMQHLDAWYLSIKLKESCEMLNRARLLGAKYELPLLDGITHFLAEADHDFWKVPSVRIYYQIWLCLTETDPRHFSRLMTDMGELISYFPKEEARGIYKHAQNYCIRRINDGDMSYLEAIFKLYQTQLENGVIFDEQGLAHTDFKNITTVGLRLKQYPWVESFIAKYKDQVALADRQNVHPLCLASLYLETGRESEAIRLLQQMRFTDVYYDISARHLLLKWFYQQADWESALYQIEAFAVFLRRNRQLSPKNRQPHEHFLRLSKRLVRLQDKKAYLGKAALRQQCRTLQKQIDKARPLAHKAWLEEQMRDLHKQLV